MFGLLKDEPLTDGAFMKWAIVSILPFIMTAVFGLLIFVVDKEFASTSMPDWLGFMVHYLIVFGPSYLVLFLSNEVLKKRVVDFIIFSLSLVVLLPLQVLFVLYAGCEFLGECL